MVWFGFRFEPLLVAGKQAPDHLAPTYPNRGKLTDSPVPRRANLATHNAYWRIGFLLGAFGRDLPSWSLTSIGLDCSRTANAHETLKAGLKDYTFPALRQSPSTIRKGATGQGPAHDLRATL